jgi:hypothetical protein
MPPGPQTLRGSQSQLTLTLIAYALCASWIKCGDTRLGIPGLTGGPASPRP